MAVLVNMTLCSGLAARSVKPNSVLYYFRQCYSVVNNRTSSYSNLLRLSSSVNTNAAALHRSSVSLGTCQRFTSSQSSGTNYMFNTCRSVFVCNRYISRTFKRPAGKTPSLTQEILESRVVPPNVNSQGAAQDQSSTSDAQRIGGKISSSGKYSGEKTKGWRTLFSKENAWKVGLLTIGSCTVIIGIELIFIWGRPEIDENGNMVQDAFSSLPAWLAYPKRALLQMHFYKKMIQEPSSLKLLPDPLKEPWYQPPYTVVLEMTGILVHPDWTIGTGWRFKKRPAVDYFLQQIGPPLFEIVIYTHEQGFTAFPIIDGLDPNGHIMYRLFRDATRYTNGCHVKDLDCLNRDLSKVIIVDCDPKAFSLNPQNAFLLQKWTGDDADRTLVDLAAFLRMIALSDVEDVRTVLEYYSQFDDPLGAFKEKQRLLQEQQELARSQEHHKKSLTSGWSFGLSGRKKS